MEKIGMQEQFVADDATIITPFWFRFGAAALKLSDVLTVQRQCALGFPDAAGAVNNVELAAHS
jgi:hypothetical protein